MKVIAYKNLPRRAPVLATAVEWLLLDRLHAPEWLWISWFVLLGLVWGAWCFSIGRQKEAQVIFDPRDLK